MQMRIAKSVRDNRWGKAKALQRLVSRSFYCKLWAVKCILNNKGSRTPGIDGVRWNTPTSRWRAALNLRVRDYKAQPLRRLYILKKNGRQRPLGIPTLHDRAMQMLFALGLKPVAETIADKHSYGFREARSLHDAVKMGYICLAKEVSAKWILEADIKACFDEISHDWLMENIPLPRRILKQWLTCGYMESQAFYETEQGTPQGGIISPILCNMTLDGLESLVKTADGAESMKLNVIRYADDFIVSGTCPEYLDTTLKPVIEAFMAERGLRLSQEKTRISHINNGFDFLGMNFRKFDNKLLIQPQKGKTNELVTKVSSLLTQYRGQAFHVVLTKINQIIRGWAYAHRKVVVKKRMSWVDNQIFGLICLWLKREHRNKSWKWITAKYRVRYPSRTDFAARYVTEKGFLKIIRLFRASDLPVRYHIKVRGDANPYLPEFAEYFADRKKRQKQLALKDRLHMQMSYIEKLAA